MCARTWQQSLQPEIVSKKAPGLRLLLELDHVIYTIVIRVQLSLSSSASWMFLTEFHVNKPLCIDPHGLKDSKTKRSLNVTLGRGLQREGVACHLPCESRPDAAGVRVLSSALAASDSSWRRYKQRATMRSAFKVCGMSRKLVLAVLQAS